MRKGYYKGLIHRYGMLLNIVIMLIGVVLVILSILVGLSKECGQVLMSIGASVLASSIVTIITTKYFYKHNTIKEIIEKWGLKGIYRTRSEMNIETNIDLIGNKKELNIIAFGLKNFRQTCTDIVQAKVKGGMQIRILTIDPRSPFLKEREKVEVRNEGSIKLDIINLNDWVHDLKIHEIYENQVLIKFYDSLPIDFYFGLDNTVYMGPYLFGYESQQTISYAFKKNSEGYDYYSNYFTKLWNDQKFCKELEVKFEL